MSRHLENFSKAMDYQTKTIEVVSKLETSLDTYHNALVRSLSSNAITHKEVVDYIPLQPNTSNVDRKTQINNTFKSIIDSFEETLQELLALKTSLAQNNLEYEGALVEARGIKNSTKLLNKICDFDDEIKSTSQQLVFIRNDIRHRASSARRDLKLILISIQGMIDGQEVKTSILNLTEEKTVDITNKQTVRDIKQGQEIFITEEEIQNTIYTVRLITYAIINSLSKSHPEIPEITLTKKFTAISAYL